MHRIRHSIPSRVSSVFVIAGLLFSGILFTGNHSALAATPDQQAVFVSGEGGYHTYRIPAVTVTTKGTVLAFCEGRKGSTGDSGDIDLLLKRSEDGGDTWSEQQVVWDDGPNTCGNPAPVVDRATGTIWLLLTWNRGDDREPQIIDGTSTNTRDAS